MGNTAGQGLFAPRFSRFLESKTTNPIATDDFLPEGRTTLEDVLKVLTVVAFPGSRVSQDRILRVIELWMFIEVGKHHVECANLSCRKLI